MRLSFATLKICTVDLHVVQLHAQRSEPSGPAVYGKKCIKPSNMKTILSVGCEKNFLSKRVRFHVNHLNMLGMLISVLGSLPYILSYQQSA